MLSEIKHQIARIVTEAHSAEAAAELSFRPVPSAAKGDVAIVVFPLARKVGTDPKALAASLATRLTGVPGIAEAVAAGPYINLSFDRGTFARRFMADVAAGDATAMKPSGARVLIEHTSINPNASPHVGRGRNAIIGDTIARLYRFLGNETEVHYYVNDIGKQIEERSDGTIAFHITSLYPTLYRLEAKGMIEGRWVEKAGQRRRRYYRLTPGGRGTLVRQRSIWENFAKAVNRIAGVKHA